MPIFILAGLAVLINNVIFPRVFEGETLARFKVWGRSGDQWHAEYRGVIDCTDDGTGHWRAIRTLITRSPPWSLLCAALL